MIRLAHHHVLAELAKEDGDYVRTSRLISGKFTAEQILEALEMLRAHRFIHESQFIDGPRVAISDDGQTFLSALEIVETAGLASKGVPLQVSCCRHREPEIEEPAVATVCIREDDLDDWWNEQDVEIKSEVFLLFTLGADAAVHDCPETRIRIGGAIGEPRTPVNQGDGDGAADRPLCGGSQ